MTALDLAAISVPLIGGVLLENGGRVDRVGLRRLSGREEDWLARHPGIANAVAITELIASCVDPDELPMPPRHFTRQLLIAHRALLMADLRRITLAHIVPAVYDCPSCQRKMDVTLDLAEAPVEGALQTQIAFEMSLDSGRSVRFRLPNGGDQEAVAGMAFDDAVSALFDRCLIDGGGAELSESDRQAISDEMERIAPNLEIELDLECPECAHQFSVEFDVASFFFAELLASQKTLLREVHHLAFHYGWSEEAILALDRGRRRAYLSLLADELRPE